MSRERENFVKLAKKRSTLGTFTPCETAYSSAKSPNNRIGEVTNVLRTRDFRMTSEAKAIFVPENGYKNDTLSHCVKGVLNRAGAAALNMYSANRAAEVWPNEMGLGWFGPFPRGAGTQSGQAFRLPTTVGTSAGSR